MAEPQANAVQPQQGNPAKGVANKLSQQVQGKNAPKPDEIKQIAAKEFQKDLGIFAPNIFYLT